MRTPEFGALARGKERAIAIARENPASGIPSTAIRYRLAIRSPPISPRGIDTDTAIDTSCDVRVCRTFLLLSRAREISNTRKQPQREPDGTGTRRRGDTASGIDSAVHGSRGSSSSLCTVSTSPARPTSITELMMLSFGTTKVSLLPFSSACEMHLMRMAIVAL